MIRGVRGVEKGYANATATLDRETAKTLVEAVNVHYPNKTNGSLKGAMEIIVEEWLEIPAEISAADAQKLIELTGTSTLCQALTKLGMDRLKQNGHKP